MILRRGHTRLFWASAASAASIKSLILVVAMSRFDILFEPVKIGPVTARNRFYQVPHCSGMGYRYPNAEAHLRGMKSIQPRT